MTGFRLAKGGAQEQFGVQADLVTFGKIIGGGLPVGAFGGKKEIMSKIAPLGEVDQAGTLFGNPLAMVAALATLAILNDNPLIYKQLEGKTEQLKIGIAKPLSQKGIPFRINQTGSMVSVHFCESDVVDFTTASLGYTGTLKR